MLRKLAGAVWLAGMLNGLCATAATNTTGAAQGAIAPAPPGEFQMPAPMSLPDLSMVPPPAFVTPPRIALLLPLRSEALGPAAEAVRAGFMAAHQRDGNGTIVTVFETGDAPEDVLSGYAGAVASNDIVVGPLSRTDVSALASSRTIKISKPTIMLTQPDLSGNPDGILPPQLLIIGLSVEDEARQVANWADNDKKNARAFVLSTRSTWQRRAAKAFAAQWQQKGAEVQSMELPMAGGAFSAGSIAALKKRIQAERPGLLFLALDAAQGRQIRAAIGSEVALYGISQLNPLAPQKPDMNEHFPEMDGVRLVDMPWQIQLDHSAVMVYPRAETPVDQKRSADLERLYALGIDAYRIAQEINAHHENFDIDGVSGKLSIGFGAGPARFQRTLLPAVYQGGIVVPMAPMPPMAPTTPAH